MRRIISLLPLAIISCFCSFSQSGTSCSEQLYTSLFTNNDSTFEVFDMALLTDGGAVLCGTRGTPDTIDPVLIRINAQGQKVWEKVLQMPGINYLWKVIRTKDGNFVSSGWITDLTSSNLLVKFDLSGNIIWNKQYSYNSIENPASGFLKEDDAGNLYTAGYFLENNLGFQDRFSLEKYDADGNVIWSKMITPGNGITMLRNADFIIRGGSSYMTGYMHNYYYVSGLFLKINNTTGAVEWSRLYDFDDREVTFNTILPASDGFILCGRNGLNATDTTVFFKTDLDGKLKATYQFVYPLVRDFEKFSIDESDNVYYALGTRTSDLTNDAVTMARINLSSGITWMKQQVTTSGYFPRVSDLKVQGGKIFFTGGAYTETTRYGFAGQMYVSGHSGCQQLPMSATFSATSGSWRDTTLLSQNKTRINVNTTLITANPGIAVNQLCSINSTCDNITISTDSIFFCSLSDTLSVSYTKNAECSLEPAIEYDHQLLSLVSNNNGTARFVAKRAGQSYVHVNVNTRCGVISDSIYTSFTTLHPADWMKTTLVNRRSLRLLEAPKGFASYFWDDGSTGDTLTVKHPGEYHVKITDRCGNQFSDTITVTLPKIDSLNRPVLSNNAVIQYPSAFTPNGDGRNDFFAPALQTRVESYQLTVYDASGKIVFITRDPYTKWDGSQKSVPLPTGSFVWKCSYSIPGAGRRSDSGVVVLIR